MTKRMWQIVHFSSFYTDSSIFKGSARLADLFGILGTYRHEAFPQKQDANALKRDWMIVGNDMEGAIKQYGEKNTGESAKKTK